MPFFSWYSSTSSRTFRCFLDIFSSAGFETSLSKWPEFARTHPSLMTLRSPAVTTSLQPVAVTMKSACFAASVIGMTANPSILASIALIGSISQTRHVRAHALRAHGDAPAAPAVAGHDEVPAREIWRLVEFMIPSIVDWPVPYLLSNRYFM